MSDSSKCSIEGYEGCDLEAYKDHKECVLHCSKEKAARDYHASFDMLDDFYKQLIVYIVKQIYKEKEPIHGIGYEEVYKYFGISTSIKPISDNQKKNVEKVLKDQIVTLDYIAFPVRDGREKFDYLPVLNMLEEIHFNYCKFYISWLEIPETEVYFQDCEFYESWHIYDYAMLDNVDDVIYQECVFHDNVSASNSGEKNKKYVLKNSQFMDCKFCKALELDQITVTQPLFSNTEHTVFNIGRLSINNCEFEDRFILNKYSIGSTSITGSVFNKKFEFKENIATSFTIEDSNFTELAEFFGTKFEKFFIYKSIFTDYIGFEHCTFGKKDVDDIDKAEFKYSTFLNFVNFRNTKFLSGLDLENTNFKESPNFLKSEINLETTNRETFRIIKHSFDKIGNHVEANKFFAFEMQKYKEELSNNNWYEQKKLVLWFNDKISNFGQDFYRPLLMMLLSIIIFSSLYYAFNERWLYKIAPDYNMYFQSFSNFINGFAKGLIPFSKFFVAGMEFISLVFYVVNLILIWQIVVAVKRHTRR